MRVDLATLATWVGMMLATYSSRVAGFWFVRRFPIGGRLKIEAPIPPDFAHMAEIAGVSAKEPQAG